MGCFSNGPELIVYGGSFDPPHLGHQMCVETGLARFSQARVMVVPSKSPVYKVGCAKPVAATFSERVEMCRLAFLNEGLGASDRVFVSTIEDELSGPCFSLFTLKAISQIYPKKNLCFMMGDDQWSNFTHWFSPSEVLQLASIFVIRRDCHTKKLFEEMTIKVCRDLGEADFAGSYPGCVRLKDLGSSVYYSDTYPCSATSSELREKMYLDSNRVDIATTLHADVATYIKDHQMYKSTERK